MLPQQGAKCRFSSGNDPSIVEGKLVSAPTAIGVNIAPREDVGTSSHLTDASEE